MEPFSGERNSPSSRSESPAERLCSPSGSGGGVGSGCSGVSLPGVFAPGSGIPARISVCHLRVPNPTKSLSARTATASGATSSGARRTQSSGGLSTNARRRHCVAIPLSTSSSIANSWALCAICSATRGFSIASRGITSARSRLRWQQGSLLLSSCRYATPSIAESKSALGKPSNGRSTSTFCTRVCSRMPPKPRAPLPRTRCASTVSA